MTDIASPNFVESCKTFGDSGHRSGCGCFEELQLVRDVPRYGLMRGAIGRVRERLSISKAVLIEFPGKKPLYFNERLLEKVVMA